MTNYGVHPISHPFAPATVWDEEVLVGPIEKLGKGIFFYCVNSTLSTPPDLRRCRIPGTCACDDISRHGASVCSEPQSCAHRRCQTQGFEVPPRLPSAGQGFLAFDLLAFVRFLYFLARKRAMAFCAAISQEYPSRKELCQQCGAFFYQHRSRIGFLRVLGFCRCPRRCLSINRILSLASSQACALVCVGGFGASEGQRSAGSAPPRRQAPIQGAWAHGLQDDLDANLGGPG